jgi:hypothetical protein
MAAVIASDGSALLLVADPLHHPGLLRVLQEFEVLKSDAPLLALTSLNRSGDPPALDLPQAQDLARRAGLDVLYWQGKEHYRGAAL